MGLGECRFLVVDSNEYMRQILDAVLRGFGARTIFKARDGHEALQHLRHATFDVMTTDFVLPCIDGVELTRQLRHWEDNPNRYIPVIMVTAYASRPRVELARDAGVSEVCCKPVTPRELFRKLVAVTDYSRAFVQSQAFIGPDRRRRQDVAYAGPERRYDGVTAADHAALEAAADMMG